MAKVIRSTEKRIEVFRAAWKKVAPAATFAGMTLAEFELAVSPPAAVRKEIKELERETKAKLAERADADTAAEEVLELVINSVRGTPGFGADSQAYRAFGYVRKSERKSGMTRKGKTPDAANVV
jgi:hypothetical protein